MVVDEASVGVYLRGVTIGDQVDDHDKWSLRIHQMPLKTACGLQVGIASFGEQGSIYYHVGDVE